MSILNEPLQSLLVKPKRQIGTIAVNVIISEETSDELEITQQPVQQGAMISDHAFKKPTNFSMRASWRYNFSPSLSQIYQQLLTLQNSRIPFTVVTPKRTYSNMLLSGLTQTTDKSTENCLMIYCKFQEILIVNVSATSVPRSSLGNAGSNGATQPAGVKQSFLYTGSQAIGAKP